MAILDVFKDYADLVAWRDPFIRRSIDPRLNSKVLLQVGPQKDPLMIPLDLARHCSVVLFKHLNQAELNASTPLVPGRDAELFSTQTCINFVSWLDMRYRPFVASGERWLSGFTINANHEREISAVIELCVFAERLMVTKLREDMVATLVSTFNSSRSKVSINDLDIRNVFLNTHERSPIRTLIVDMVLATRKSSPPLSTSIYTLDRNIVPQEFFEEALQRYDDLHQLGCMPSGNYMLVESTYKQDLLRSWKLGGLSR